MQDGLVLVEHGAPKFWIGKRVALGRTQLGEGQSKGASDSEHVASDASAFTRYQSAK
jgi:hypothetical protein